MDYTNVIIEWDELRMRCITLEDAETIFKEFTPDIVTYMYPPSPSEIEETIDFIDTSIATAKEGYNMQFVLEIASTHEFLGAVGLHKVHSKTPEFGVWIKKDAHGNGYGRRAINKLYDYASKILDVDHYLYPFDERNAGSRKIAESLGGVYYDKEDIVNESGNKLKILNYHVPAKRESNE